MFCSQCGTSIRDSAKFCTGCGAQTVNRPPQPEQAARPVPAAYSSQPPGGAAAETPIWWDVQSPQAAAAIPRYTGTAIPPKKKRLPVIAAAVSAVILLGGLGWLLFPAILKAVNTDMYISYAFGRTGSVLSGELKSARRAFGIPDLPDGSVRVATELNGVRLTNNSRWGTQEFDLSKLQAGYDMLYDLDNKRTSLDIRAGWDGESVLLTLYADMQKIAAGFNDDVSWAVSTSAFGRELAALGLPVDEAMSLDLGFLFPETESTDGFEEDIAEIVEAFLKSLNFRENTSAEMPDGFRGSAMTAAVDDGALREMLEALADIYLDYVIEAMRPMENMIPGVSFENEYRTMRDEMYRELRQIHLRDAELTLFINSRNIVSGIQLDVSEPGSSVSISAHLLGEKNLIDHIQIKVSDRSGWDRNTATIDIQGQHVPVNGEFSSTLTVRGPNMDTIRVNTSIIGSGRMTVNALAGSDEIFSLTGRIRSTGDAFSFTLNSLDVDFGYEQVSLAGELTVTVSGDVSDIRDISRGAHSLADFDISQLKSLFQSLELIVNGNTPLSTSADSSANTFAYLFYQTIAGIYPEYSEQIRNHYWNYWDYAEFRLVW
ncbi:MAG: zinc ribbon domain-containing protein [Oscillospiraceae bacterium]|nr:zinc ribbon domain-containing protein [Oscillospiraceae bacterium]